MPFIDVRLFEERLTPATEQQLISELTDAVTRVFGADARAHTWVALTGSPARRWGIAGTPGKPPAGDGTPDGASDGASGGDLARPGDGR